MAIPDLDCCIVAAGGDVWGVMGPAYSFDRGAVAGIRAENISCERIPDLRGGIVTAREDGFAIGRPGQRVDGAIMTAIDYDVAPCGGIPDLGGAVKVPCCDVGAVGRPAYGEIAVLLAASIGCLACNGIPYLNRTVAEISA